MYSDEYSDMNWETYSDIGSGVSVKVDPSKNPVMCAAFDGEEQITEECAALQLEETIMQAKAYKKAKVKYNSTEG